MQRLPCWLTWHSCTSPAASGISCNCLQRASLPGLVTLLRFWVMAGCILWVVGMKDGQLLHLGLCCRGSMFAGSRTS